MVGGELKGLVFELEEAAYNAETSETLSDLRANLLDAERAAKQVLQQIKEIRAALAAPVK